MISNNYLLIPFWQYNTLDEILSNNIFYYEKLDKIILKLKKQKITLNDFKRIEEKNWLLIEIEDVMEKSTSKDLENYMQIYFKEIENISKENQLTNELLEYRINKIKKIEISDFLN